MSPEDYLHFLGRATRLMQALMRTPGLRGGGHYKAPVGAAPVFLIVARGDLSGVPYSQATIKEMTGLSQSACQRCAAFLVDSGLVRFEDDPEDGRKVRCLLTAQGRLAVENLYAETRSDIDPLAGKPEDG